MSMSCKSFRRGAGIGGDAHYSEVVDEPMKHDGGREKSPIRDRSTHGLTGRAKVTDEDVRFHFSTASSAL